MATRTRTGVGVVVRSAEGLVLVGRRRAEPGAPLAVPGGKLDPGESIEECAVRELAEETGLVVGVDAVRTFACVLVAGWLVAGVEAPLPAPAQPRGLEPDKFGDFAWIDPAAAPSGLFPATAALLARL